MQCTSCTSQGCLEQVALEGQDLPHMYLARHELESVSIIIVIVVINYDTYY